MSTDLSHNQFTECRFENCDLSNAILTHALLRDVYFKGCKLLGIQFSDCNTLFFSPRFESCQLRLASFYRCALKKTSFINCQLEEVDFAEADLRKARLDNCDLTQALFDGTNLEGADLSSAYHFSIDPERNKLKKARFSADQLAGLLQKYQIIINR